MQWLSSEEKKRKKKLKSLLKRRSEALWRVWSFWKDVVGALHQERLGEACWVSWCGKEGRPGSSGWYLLNFFFPFGYGQQYRKHLEKDNLWNSLISSYSVSARVIFPVHSHKTQKRTPKAQNKIKAVCVPPPHSGMFKNCFFPARMCSVVSVTSFLLSVNSNSQSPGLKVWERLKPKRDASSVMPQAARIWCWMVLSLWSLLWVWEQLLWDENSPSMRANKASDSFY